MSQEQPSRRSRGGRRDCVSLVLESVTCGPLAVIARRKLSSSGTAACWGARPFAADVSYRRRAESGSWESPAYKHAKCSANLLPEAWQGTRPGKWFASLKIHSGLSRVAALKSSNPISIWISSLVPGLLLQAISSPLTLCNKQLPGWDFPTVTCLILKPSNSFKIVCVRTSSNKSVLPSSKHSVHKWL